MFLSSGTDWVGATAHRLPSAYPVPIGRGDHLHFLPTPPLFRKGRSGVYSRIAKLRRSITLPPVGVNVHTCFSTLFSCLLQRRRWLSSQSKQTLMCSAKLSRQPPRPEVNHNLPSLSTWRCVSFCFERNLSCACHLLLYLSYSACFYDVFWARNWNQSVLPLSIYRCCVGALGWVRYSKF